MPAIQAMRSDALALRAKEDVQEKIPSFFNSVNQALGQSVVAGQDAAEQLIEQRFQAANTVAAQLRQKVDGQGALAEMTVGAGTKLISSALNTILMVLQKTTTTDLIEIASDIANFLIERKTLQLQWDAAAATYAQWTVQAGYAGNGDFFGSATNPMTGPVEYSITQWLEAPAPAGIRPGDPGYPPTADAGFTTINGIKMATQSGLSWLDGTTFTTVPYNGATTTQNIPGNLQVYQYQPRNWQGELAYEFMDHDNNPQTAMVPADGTNPKTDPVTGAITFPTNKKVASVGISIDTNNDNRFGNPGGNATSAADDDQGSMLYYSPDNGGKWYIKNTVVVTVPAGATSYSVPHRSVTINSSGIDYQLHTKGSGQTYGAVGAQGDYADSGSANYDWDLTALDTRFDDRPNDPGVQDLKDYDFNESGTFTDPLSVDAADATGDADGDGTIGNGQFLDGDPGPIVNLQYRPGFDGDDLLPQTFIPPRYVRASDSDAGSHTVNRPIQNRAIFNNAMGGRGAIRYRDALTPRYTDRKSYSGSDLGVGAYETYYAWGSVGSITRVGQY